MSKKSFIYNGLKCSVAGIALLTMVACASVNSDDWLKMQADNLWQELEQSDAKSVDVTENGSASLSKPPFSGTEISLADVRSTLGEIDGALPGRAMIMSTAVEAYNAAPSDDKARYWRGVEVEKSRLNGLISALRHIEFKIANNDAATAELILTRKLLSLATSMSPSTPSDIDLAAMRSAVTEAAPFDNQMAAAADKRAVEAGMEILNKGGSAVDAAVAIETMLSLVEPQSSGVGGGGFMIHYDPNAEAGNQVRSYDGRETAPALVGPELFKHVYSDSEKEFDEAVIGGQSVGTPGVLKMLKLAHDNHGILPWKELFEPAIKKAEEGFIVSPRLSWLVERNSLLKRASSDAESIKYFFDENREAHKPGHLLKNPKYANVLRRVANEGVEAFYTGEIAEKIANAVQTSEHYPSSLSVDDLANYTAKERDIICGPYRVYTVCSMPSPSSGGHTIVASLGMLERFDIGAMEPYSVEAMHLILESQRLAFADRNQFSGDSDFVHVPIKGLVDLDYLAERSKLIEPEKSMGIAEHGNPPSDMVLDLAADQSIEIPSTTHFVITDKWGHVVSMTATVESAFGSRVMVEGFFLNNELTDFSLSPEVDGKLVNNRVEGGKRPRSSMTPTIVFDKDMRPVLVIGSPGGANIIGYVTQTVINVLDWGMDMQTAIDAPNILNKNGTSLIERGTTAIDLLEPLRALGHEAAEDGLNSGLHGIIIKYNEDGSRSLDGGADPRREGIVSK